jgi:N-acetylglutamate synthase-like GNAT family acetyltransferase
MPLQIRKATPVDMPQLLDMLRKYREHTPLDFLAEADNVMYITQMLSEIMAGRGVVLVAEKDGLIGMLIAGVHPSRWSPSHLLLTELAWWVDPEHRGGTAGHRLLKRYLAEAEKMKEEGRICNFFISKMSNSPDLDYSRFGFKYLEEFWVQ